MTVYSQFSFFFFFWLILSVVHAAALSILTMHCLSPRIGSRTIFVVTMAALSPAKKTISTFFFFSDKTALGFRDCDTNDRLSFRPVFGVVFPQSLKSFAEGQRKTLANSIT